MAPRIFITRPIPQNAVKHLVSKGYHVDVYGKDDVISRKKLLKTLRSGSYDALLCLLTDKIDGEIFDAGKTLKLVVNYATGFDNIDLSYAKEQGWHVIVSHRSGETNDTVIADIAVGISASFLKAGAPNRGERIAKYNRLMEIETALLLS